MKNSMQAKQEQHIVIVGGGMVGISLALLLSKKLSTTSTRITLIEQHSLVGSADVVRSSFDDRSTALSAGTAEIFQHIGCWSPIKSHATAISQVHVSDKGHFSGVQLNSKDYSLPALGYVVENKKLGSVLVNLLNDSGVHCLAPATVNHCLAKKSGYELQVEIKKKSAKVDCLQENQQEKIDADLVLIADGADSPIRSSLGIGVDKKDYQQSALIANIALAEDHGGVAYERFTNEGPIAVLPLSSLDNVHRAALVWTLPQGKFDGIAKASEQELIALLQQRFGFRAGKITGIGERHVYPLQLIKAQEQVRSHLVVVGNAAHFLHPVAGQGFNLALRDCKVLSDCLLEAEQKGHSLGSYSTLKAYIEQQGLDQDITIGLTDTLVKLFSSSHLPKEILRQLGLSSLNFLPSARNQFAQRMMGLNSFL
ncbi:MAG: 2-octaprenyl-6-methoxyphenyl hydroxylase [Cellvibrionaceae bacterium]